MEPMETLSHQPRFVCGVTRNFLKQDSDGDELFLWND